MGFVTQVDEPSDREPPPGQDRPIARIEGAVAGQEANRQRTNGRAFGRVDSLDVGGHGVSDFPHAIYKAGKLGDFENCPATGIWILEIQIRHPTRPFGAFFEDLLVGEP